MPRLLLVFASLIACRGEANRFAPTGAAPAPVASAVVAPTWISVAGGSYLAGSPDSERCREADETRRTATVAPFEITRSETTRAQFLAVMAHDPSFAPDCTDPACPVVSVTWHEAVDYCRRLDPDHPARLPTELEWELAARAGTTTALPSGDVESCMSRDTTSDEVAWTKASSGGASHIVATRAPNAWGLHDMAGNAAEWVADAYRSDPTVASPGDSDSPTAERVVRGGDWYHNAEHARSAARERLDPEARMSWVGFRCARSAR